MRISDNGSTMDNREIHQGSLRTPAYAQIMHNLHRTVLGVVLSVQTSDSFQNRSVHQRSDRHAAGAVCEVLVMNDGKSASTFWRLSNVRVLPAHPSGLDNYEEALPRGSSKLVNGDDFDITAHDFDIHDLDGDWVVVSFVGGNEHLPYISNYWPSPRNSLDPQTVGTGHPNSAGEGQALKQSQGRGRYFRRINGVEQVINERGDIFLSTYYAGGDITPNPEGTTTNGRFSREIASGEGGGIRLNMKTSQPLELNWNEQVDGIGLNDAHDPGLPQTNPPQLTPYPTGDRSSTFIQITNQAVSLEVPTMFNVKSRDQLRLESLADSAIIVGNRLNVSVASTMGVSVGSSYTVTSTTGNIEFTTDLGNINTVATAGDINTTAAAGSITLDATAGNITATAGVNLDLTATAAMSLTSTASTDITSTGAIAVGGSSLAFTAGTMSFGLAGGLTNPVVNLGSAALEPAIKGTTYTGSETTLYTAIGAFATAVGVEVPALAGAATTLNLAITAWGAALTGAISTTTNIG